MNIRSIRTHRHQRLSTEMCWPSQATLTSTGQSQLSFEALWTKAAALQHHGAKVVIFLPCPMMPGQNRGLWRLWYGFPGNPISMGV
jgi:hypothetical protein